MKYCLPVFITLMLLFAGGKLFSQRVNKPVYVIVHGAWGGGWAFKKIDSLLTHQKCEVYRPTLTGQGERVHAALRDVGLSTHIQDIVNLILYEDLNDVILVGHSYGGMVVTGVADSLPGRISKLIYVDAFVPENNESVMEILSSRTTGLTANGIKKQLANGFIIPSWVALNTLPPKDVPQSFKTFSDTIILKNTGRSNIPARYILTVDKGKNARDDDFFEMAERARRKGWPVFQLEADHNPQWSAPEALVKMLMMTGSK